MKVAKRLKAAYVLRGKNAIPLGENIFQFKLKTEYKEQRNKIGAGKCSLKTNTNSQSDEAMVVEINAANV